MRRIAMAGAAMASLAAMSLTYAGTDVLKREEPPEPPKPRKKAVKRKKRAKAAPSYFTTRGRYIPGGEYRNCGDNGISPKLMRRHLNG